MFTPHSLAVALIMMITSAICWGSWANTYKGVKNYRFELFYWDYAIGIFLVSLILALTMGSTGNDASSFLNNVRSADTENIVYMMIGGAIFNLANLLLVAAIDMAGLAVAFPVSIGIALVVGVIFSYIRQPKGNAALLAAGAKVDAPDRIGTTPLAWATGNGNLETARLLLKAGADPNREDKEGGSPYMAAYETDATRARCDRQRDRRQGARRPTGRGLLPPHRQSRDKPAGRRPWLAAGRECGTSSCVTTSCQRGLEHQPTPTGPFYELRIMYIM